MSGHTLKAARTASTSRYKRTASAKLQLKSVQKQSVKLLIFSFFFFVGFYTVSFIYNKITHLLLYFICFFFKKRTTWYTPILWVQEEKIDHIRRVSERERVNHLSVFKFFFNFFVFSCPCRLWSLSFMRDNKSSSSRFPRVSLQWVSFGDMLMRNQREVTCLLLFFVFFCWRRLAVKNHAL